MRLPDGVLADDECVLPASPEHGVALGSHAGALKADLSFGPLPRRSQLSDSDSESVASSTSSSSSNPPPAQHSFPTLTALIQTLLAFHRPSGLFPKLNSTAPQDAQWILPLPQPMKCSTAEDVFMVLKASGLMNGVLDSSALAGRPAEERGGIVEGDPEEGGREEGEQSIDGVVEDLSEAQLEGERVELVLKKWYDMDRSREFRLFVRGDVLVGASSLGLPRRDACCPGLLLTSRPRAPCRHLATRHQPLPAPACGRHAVQDQDGAVVLLRRDDAQQVPRRARL